MNLILSDKQLRLPIDKDSVEFIDLSSLHIANCVGCFGCWTKTPGKCVIRDDAVTVYPKIAASRRLLYISRVKYGGYDTVMKTMLERSIPVQQAFIRLLNGETHHVQRAVAPNQATIIGYGDIPDKEKEVFTQLIARNANNMCFEEHRVIFARENELEEIVGKEVLSWRR